MGRRGMKVLKNMRVQTYSNQNANRRTAMVQVHTNTFPHHPILSFKLLNREYFLHLSLYHTGRFKRRETSRVLYSGFSVSARPLNYVYLQFPICTITE